MKLGEMSIRRAVGDPAERVNLSQTSEVRECTTWLSRGEGFQAEATAKSPGRVVGGEAKKQRVGDLCKVAPTWQEQVSHTMRQKVLRRGRDGKLCNGGGSQLSIWQCLRLWTVSEAALPPTHLPKRASPGRTGSLAGPLLLLALECTVPLGWAFAPWLPIKAQIRLIFL